jgi:hypothetical protein
VTLSLRIVLPPAFPLRRADVICEKRMGVPEDRWRRWELQMKTMLASKVRGGATERDDDASCSVLWRAPPGTPCPACCLLATSAHTPRNPHCRTARSQTRSRCGGGRWTRSSRAWSPAPSATPSSPSTPRSSYRGWHGENGGRGVSTARHYRFLASISQTACGVSTRAFLCSPTCRNKFHGWCLYKWFDSSHESLCPLCRQPFR